jgi:hypothetical protein
MLESSDELSEPRHKPDKEKWFLRIVIFMLLGLAKEKPILKLENFS